MTDTSEVGSLEWEREREARMDTEKRLAEPDAQEFWLKARAEGREAGWMDRYEAALKAHRATHGQPSEGDK